MPSFTSSFERAPVSRWRLNFVIVVLVALSLLASFEFFWRIRGVEPNYFDDPRRWSYFRDQVKPLTNQNSTILVGASRIQLGWSMDKFRSMMPQTPIIQLAIDGTHPWAVLRDLSENTKLSGAVVVALSAAGILPGARNAAQIHVDFYADSWTPNNQLNFLLDDFLQQYLITRQPRYGVNRTVTAMAGGDLQGGANYLETTRERERNADYRRLDIIAHRAERIRRVAAHAAKFSPPTTAVWDKSVRELDQIVRPMVQRGARVVFIRFPTSGEHWELDEEMFPRERYWDDMASRVSGHWVHFKDIDGIDSFILPDTSHLDKRDKAEFTRLIIVKLRELGVY